MDSSDPSSPPPSSLLRRRRHHSPLSLSACFRPSSSASASSSAAPSPSAWSQLSSPSTWFRSSKTPPYRPLRHHRRHHSADFRYDAVSYSLNFDEGELEPDEVRPPAFPSRLPDSPVTSRREKPL